MRLRPVIKKKGQLATIQSLVVAIVGIALVLVFGFLIFAQAKSEIQNNEGINSSGQNSSGEYPSYMWNATQETIGAYDDIPAWLPIIIITSIGAGLLGLVYMFKVRGY